MRKFFSMILMMVLCAGVAVAETATVGDCTWTYKEKMGPGELSQLSRRLTKSLSRRHWTALRKYTTYGKVSLADEKWNEVSGDAAKYNFFKVAVEMKR